MIKKYRKDGDVSYALGATVVMELMKRRPQDVRAVYISPKSNVVAVIEKAREIGAEIIESEKAFNILSPKENCFAIAEFGKFDAKISGDRHHVVLVNPSNAGNLGTVVRDVAAFDCADLAIIRPAVDPFDPKTVRASMGTVFDINFELFDSFDAYVKRFDNEIVPFMLGGSPFREKSFTVESGAKKYSLVFGNEATGLPQEFERFGAVRIEQSKNVDSLNLSTAVAVGLYKLYTSRSGNTHSVLSTAEHSELA